MTELVPVSVVTGFLGSGKTTLLNRLLRDPAMSDAAVIINEFGDVGLDHQLVEAAEGDVVVMASGCICCTIRNSLVDTLRGLFQRRADGMVPPFRRVLIETTGLADPAPILHTLMEEPFLAAHVRLDGVVTTVDALHGLGQLQTQPESAKQAAVADRLVLTKTDLATAEQVRRLGESLARINPGAPVVAAVSGALDPAVLFEVGLYDPASNGERLRRWLAAEAYPDPDDAGSRHGANIQAHSFVWEEPLDWRCFSPNLAALISRHAEKLLRVKGILNVSGEPRPVVVHGVQHQFQRMLLDRWPDEDRRSRLVLITRGLDRAYLQDQLQARRPA